ncbi:Hypothetical protein LUCI_3224 [Lucifera butyrica]|uniref:Rqc2 homolog RqcH n=1 Tax=Lucifera butyrica TaxID=1351585 RepID=A0A498R9X6_9FIRM|nr:NFACT RNA binding domain-containing protein [Lucifera butyrica]VBB07959.1 Hypothetical protein LUCI_3224 [Lucifera butyrica]
MSLDGLSLAPLIAELNQNLAGGRIEKIFQPEKLTLLFWIRQAGQTLRLLIAANPDNPRIHLTKTTGENPATPPSFCMLLRKHLEDGRIAKVEQHELDRMIRIPVDVRGERGRILTKYLLIELMGKHSNIIFVEQDLIIDAIKRVNSHMSQFRQVLPGLPYRVPPGQNRLNLLAVEPSHFVQVLLSTQKGSLLKAVISTGLGIGPVTAREIIWQAGLPLDIAVEEVTGQDRTSLASALSNIVNHLRSDCARPVVVTDNSQSLLAIAPFPLEHLSRQESRNFPTMSLAIEFASQLKGQTRPGPETQGLQKLVAAELAKSHRKSLILKQELADARQADTFLSHGNILMNFLAAVTNGAEEVLLPDLLRDPSGKTCVAISLDPDLTPVQNAQNYYAKYNKLKRAQETLAGQLAQCETELKYLESIQISLDWATTASDALEIRQELIAAGYIKEITRCRKTASTNSRPLSALTADGFTILVGKNNLQNDFVTFKQSRPDDIWFHTKDVPGSHVILRRQAEQASPAALNTAANLAAYFSKARSSTNIPVDYTERRYVKKPAGAKPGFVIYSHQHTLYITPDEQLIKAVLKQDR